MKTKFSWSELLINYIAWPITIICMVIIFIEVFRENKACVESGGVLVRSVFWFECVDNNP
jgi:hypothetical protein